MERNLKIALIVFLAVIGIIFFSYLSNSLLINSFSSGLQNENLSFQTNENISRNFSIYRYSNVTSSYLNLSGYINNLSCYQETANVSTTCGGLSTGNYLMTNDSLGNGYFYANYTKPTNAISLKYQVRYGNIFTNFTIPDTCLNSVISFKFHSNNTRYDWDEGQVILSCLNISNTWQEINRTEILDDAFSSGIACGGGLYDGNWTRGCAWRGSSQTWDLYDISDGLVGNAIYEESMIWDITNYPTNSSISINNTQIWNYSGNFNQTNNKTKNFASTLNTALNNGKCDCSGCSLVGNNCSIPFTFHSDTAGILSYSDIQINYNQGISIISPTEGQIFTQDSPTTLFNITNDTAFDVCYAELDSITNYTIPYNGNNIWNWTNTSMVDGSHTIKYWCNQSDDGTWRTSDTINFEVDSVNITRCRDLNTARTYQLINNITSNGVENYCLNVKINDTAINMNNQNISVTLTGDSIYGISCSTVGDKNCEANFSVYNGVISVSGINTQGYGIFSTAVNSLIENITIYQFFSTTMNPGLIDMWGNGTIRNTKTISTNINISNIKIRNGGVSVYDSNFSLSSNITILSNEYGNNNFINCSYNINRETISTGKTLTRKWYFQTQVNYTHNGTAVNQANVTAYDSSGNAVNSELTDSNGRTSRWELTEYINNGGTKTFYSNYTINVTKSNWNTNSQSINITTNYYSQQFSLSDTTPPVSIASSNNLTAWTKSNVLVTITATDAGSGFNPLVYPKYCNDTTNTCSPSTFISSGVTISNEGTSYVRYNSTDYAGNSETTKSLMIKMDKTSPLVSIKYPITNINSLDKYLDVNYTIADSGSGISDCWYSNDAYSGNTTLASCGNLTAVTWAEGQHNVTIWANDTVNNQNSSSVTFTIDTTPPAVTITSPTNTTYATTISWFNLTVTDTSIGVDACFYSLDLAANITMSNLTASAFNATNATMTQGSHTAYFYCNDTLGNLNSSEKKSFFIDSIYPLLSYGLNTEVNGMNISQSNVFVNVSFTELNFANITFFLVNDTGTINTTTFTTATYTINWTALGSSNYTYQVNITDLASNQNSTLPRYITIDKVNPSSNLIFPTNNTYNSTTIQNFTSNLTDNLGIKNSVLFVDNGTGTNSWLEFDGIDDNITIPDSDFLSPNTTGQLTISFWVNFANFKFKGIAEGYVNYFGKSANPTSNVEWLFRVYNDTSIDKRPCRMSFYLFNLTGGSGIGSYFQDNDTEISCPTQNNTWVHIVGLVNGTSTFIYKNGVQRDTDIYSGIIYPQNGVLPVIIGGKVTTNTNNFFNGSIDEIRIYNRDLSTSEILEIYNSGRNTNSSLPINGLVSWWSINEGGGDTIWDQQNNNDGVIANALWKSDYYNQTSTSFVANTLTKTVGIVITLVDGIYKWWVQVWDWAGNTFTTGNNTLIIDTASPLINYTTNSDSNGSYKQTADIFINITASDTNKDSVRLEWQNINETFDNSGGDYYWENKTGLGEGTYRFYAWANDSINNFNKTDLRIVYIDLNNPAVTIVDPKEQNYNDNSSMSLNYIASDTNLQSCWWSLDAVTNNSITCGQNTTFNATETTHTIYVYANDSSGRVGSSSVTFVISLVPPSITLNYPANNAWVNYKNNVQFNYTPTDPNGISACQFWINSTGWHINQTNTAPTNASVNTLNINLTESSYIWNIWCNDTGDNGVLGNPLGNNTVHIDTVYPLLAYGLNTEVNGMNISQSNVFVNVSFTETNFANITFFLVNDTGTINTTTFTTATYTINWTALGSSNYTYQVNITDLASNQNATLPRYITIDILNPNITLIFPEDNTYNSSASQNFTANISDNLGVKNATLFIYNQTGEYNQTSVTFVANTVKSTLGIVVSLINGIYKWWYQAYDWAGNFFQVGNYTLYFDTDYPLISYGDGTEINSYNTTNTWIYVNVSVTELNEETIVFNLYNSTNSSINSSSYTSQQRTINWTGLVDGLYYYNVTVNDTSGNKNSTNTRIIRLDDTKPNVTILIPLAQNYGTNNSMSLNYSATDNFIGLKVCWYYVYNSSGSVAISTQVLSSCENTTFSLPGGDISYTLYLFTKDLLENTQYSSVTFGIRTESPVIVLTTANDTQVASTTNNFFNFTVTTNANNITNCSLYGNWTGWHLNETILSPSESEDTNFSAMTISEGDYIWNVFCYDDLGYSGFALNNNTYAIDLTYPIVNITSITPTSGSQTFSFNNSVLDRHTATCKYSIYNSSGNIDGTNSNVSFTCNTVSSATATAYALYNLTIYGKDKAGNENSSTKSFTTSSVVSEGGGGGGGEVIVVTENKTYCGDNFNNSGFTIFGIPACQSEGNDLGMKEDWFNCPQDCEAFDFDALVFAFTSNCIDRDNSTSCFFWDILLKGIVKTFINETCNNDNICQPDENFLNCEADCGKFNLDTLYTGCFDNNEETPCFFSSNISYYMLFGAFVIIVALSTIKIKSGKEKKVSIIGYIGRKFRKKRR